MTRDADVRFSPTEPDFKETSRTGMGVVRKAVNIASRLSLRILPSSTTKLIGVLVGKGAVQRPYWRL